MANEPAAPAQDAPTVEETPNPAQDASKDGETVTISAAELEKIRTALKEANGEAQKRRLEIEKRDREQAKAEEERLAEQGKFQELATTREKERDEAKADLATANDKIAQYEALLASDVDNRTAGWPDELKALVPKDGDVLQRLQRINELKPAADKFLVTPAAGGTRPGPTPNGAPVPNVEEARRAQSRVSSI